MNLRIFIPAIVIGAVVGLAVGYITFKATGGRVDFVVWISPDHPSGHATDALMWMIGAMVVAGAVAFLRRGISN
jgi:H+/Cl- antiporter ClcA